jgi:4-amino-4-deoxy-L-arabinose transferase-like glycosyltransferase
MLRSVKITSIVLAVLYITYHLVTLSYDPLPGKDETQLAGIAYKFANQNSMISETGKDSEFIKESFVCAPAYFILTGLSFKLFGFGIFQFRLINLFFGFFLVLIFSRVLKLYNFSATHVLMLTVAFLSDPFLEQSLHEANNILLSLALMILSALILFNELEKEKLRLGTVLLSGLLAGFALLTTPLISFIYLTLSTLCMGWLIKNFSPKHLLKAFLWFLPVILIYTFWTFYSFEGIPGLLSYYKESGAAYFGFFKPVNFIPKSEWLLIVCAILCLLYKLVSDEIKVNYFYLFSLLSIVVFYITVIDKGPYSVLIVPFYYFIIADSLKNISLKDVKNPFLYLSLVLLTFNFSSSSMNGFRAITEIENRNYKEADAFIKEHIPSGSKVIGDPVYFYSVKKAGSDFELLNDLRRSERNDEVNSRQLDYDYLIVTDLARKSDPETIVNYLSQAKYRKVARFEIKNSGYNADLYVRLKFDQPLPTAGLMLNVQLYLSP